MTAEPTPFDTLHQQLRSHEGAAMIDLAPLAGGQAALAEIAFALNMVEWNQNQWRIDAKHHAQFNSANSSPCPDSHHIVQADKMINSSDGQPPTNSGGSNE